jgi:hypothetical protein
MNLPTKFGSTWPSGFRKEDLKQTTLFLQKYINFKKIIQWTRLIGLVPTGPVVSEKKIKNRYHPFWHLWASRFFCVLLINYKKKTTKQKLCRGPSNEHSHQVYFQLAEWFQQRRLKCNSLQKTICTGRCQVMTILNVTLWFSVN